MLSQACSNPDGKQRLAQIRTRGVISPGPGKVNRFGVDSICALPTYSLGLFCRSIPDMAICWHRSAMSGIDSPFVGLCNPLILTTLIIMKIIIDS